MSRLGGRLLCSASLGALDSVDSAPVCALWSSALQCAMGWFRDGVDLVQFPLSRITVPGAVALRYVVWVVIRSSGG